MIAMLMMVALCSACGRRPPPANSAHAGRAPSAEPIPVAAIPDLPSGAILQGGVDARGGGWSEFYWLPGKPSAPSTYTYRYVDIIVLADTVLPGNASRGEQETFAGHSGNISITEYSGAGPGGNLSVATKEGKIVVIAETCDGCRVPMSRLLRIVESLQRREASKLQRAPAKSAT